MRATLIIAAGLLVAVVLSAQPRKQAAPAIKSQSSASILEAKVRKAWEDFKNKDKNAFAAALADDYRTVQEDGSGLRDKKSEVDAIDHFSLGEYKLTDFTVKPIGTGGALVTYVADYSGTDAGQPAHAKGAFGELWVRRGRDWKCLYEHETAVK